MAVKKKATKKAIKPKPAIKAKRRASAATKVRKAARLWLMFPQRLITKPVVWYLTKNYPYISNVHQAWVTGEF